MDTFTLTNIAPQVGKGFNRSADRSGILIQTIATPHMFEQLGDSHRILHRLGKGGIVPLAALSSTNAHIVTSICDDVRDYWARFERFVKMVAKSADEVYIVTGPLYVPKPSPDMAKGTSWLIP